MQWTGRPNINTREVRTIPVVKDTFLSLFTTNNFSSLSILRTYFPLLFLLLLFLHFIHSFTQVQNVVKVTRWLASGGVTPLKVANQAASWRRVHMIRNDASRREKLVLGRRGVSVRLRRECVVTTSRGRDQEGRS